MYYFYGAINNHAVNVDAGGCNYSLSKKKEKRKKAKTLFFSLAFSLTQQVDAF